MPWKKERLSMDRDKRLVTKFLEWRERRQLMRWARSFGDRYGRDVVKEGILLAQRDAVKPGDFHRGVGYWYVASSSWEEGEYEVTVKPFGKWAVNCDCPGGTFKPGTLCKHRAAVVHVQAVMPHVVASIRSRGEK